MRKECKKCMLKYPSKDFISKSSSSALAASKTITINQYIIYMPLSERKKGSTTFLCGFLGSSFLLCLWSFWSRALLLWFLGRPPLIKVDNYNYNSSIYGESTCEKSSWRGK